MVGENTPVLTTDPLLLEYRNRSGLARVGAGELRALGPQSAGSGPHLPLIRAAFETRLLPVVDPPDEGGLQALLDAGLEARLGVLEDLDLALQVSFQEHMILMWAGAPRDPRPNTYRNVPLQLNVQPLVDAFGLPLAKLLTRDLGRVFGPHVGMWDVWDAKQFYHEAYEMDMDEEEAAEQLADERKSYLRTHGLTDAQIEEDGPLRSAYLDWVAEQYPRSVIGHAHLFRDTLYREDWPEFSDLSPSVQKMHARFEARIEVLKERFDRSYREGFFEEDVRDDDENTGPPEEALLLTLDGKEGEYLLETWHDRAELYFNQRSPLSPPLLLVLDSENEPLDDRLHRLEKFLASFELLDQTLKELKEWITEIQAWHAQVQEAGKYQTPLFPLEPEQAPPKRNQMKPSAEMDRTFIPGVHLPSPQRSPNADPRTG